MKKSTAKNEKVYIGFDISQKKIAVYAVCGDATSKTEVTIANDRNEISRFLSQFDDPRKVCVVMETGTHSLWMSRFIESLGFEVVVAHARALRLIYAADKKNDALDARHLAELAQLNRNLLHPVKPIDEERQRDLVAVKARDLLIRQRTGIINTIRGHLRALGLSDKALTVDNIASGATDLPDAVKPLLSPLFQQLHYLALGIREYDRQIRQLCKKYPETKLLRQVTGVGEITALTFALLVGNPQHYSSGKRVSSLFGLVPRQDQSGEVDKQLGITKSGNPLMRKLLIQAANYILGNFGSDCDLKTFGQRIAARGGKIAQRKSKVAVARKLVTVLYALWKNPEIPYDPHFKATRKNYNRIQSA